MRRVLTHGRVALVSGCALAFTTLGAARAQETPTKPADEVPQVGLLEAMKSGAVAVEAEGLGDGRMSVTLTNRSRSPLRVVLPPGLVASGATGQFGGMGGMGGGGMGGGGMGGMGGGGMGGMGGGGMGGMGGGGMGGMGGGGMGGMGGGGMMGGGDLPASMGMMMLSQLIMQLVGDRDSWDQSSMMGGMGGMGGGMGGMGGGMGGMGGGGGMRGGMGGGGMGGGFRSVPPTGSPSAALRPGQTRSLPTRLVNLSGPTLTGAFPVVPKGEKLQLGDVSQLEADARTQKAMRRLSAEKAPTTLSQLVMWNVASGLDWTTIARISKGWANANELALAKDFVSRLEASKPGEDSGRIFVEVSGEGPAAAGLAEVLKGRSLLGLKVEVAVPARPEGPAVAARVVVSGGAKPEATVHLAVSDATGAKWAPAGKFALPVPLGKDGAPDAASLADAAASGILDRLVQAKLSKGQKVKGKETYKVQIDNHSPLVLNGLALTGPSPASDDRPKLLSGIAVSPRRSFVVPATQEIVDGLGLKKGIKVIAADLSGL